MRQKITPNRIFYILSLSAILIFFGQIWIFDTAGAMTLFFADRSDSFMDFFNVLMSVASGRPYDCSGLFIYPPFVGVLMLPFTALIPTDLLSNMIIEMSKYKVIPILVTRDAALITRASFTGGIALLLFSIVTVLSLVLLVATTSKIGSKVNAKFIFILLLSAPFLYEFQRSNTIILSIIFILFFVFYKDSDKRLMRELAIVALAFAAGIKVYPALFGILLLRDRRWMDALKAVVYGAAVMFVPFAFFGGTNAMRQLFETLTNANMATYAQGLYYKVDLSNTLRILGNFFQWSDRFILNIASVFPVVLLVLAVLASLFIRNRWKSIALITFAVMLTPGFNYYYALCYVAIPLIFFLKEETASKSADVYAIGFALLLSPVYLGVLSQINGMSTGIYPLTVMNMIQGICSAALYLALIFEGCFCAAARIFGHFGILGNKQGASI